jgi:hypothetical protein
MGEKTMKWTNKRWSRAKKMAIYEEFSANVMQAHIAAFLKEKWKL